MEVETTGNREGPIFRDIRRYYCEYCGICRSKKTLISSHILSHHQDKMNERKADVNEEKEGFKSNTCHECSLSFQKPAHLKQHMQSHSLEGYKLLRVMEIKSNVSREALDPTEELQNARGINVYLEWISIRVITCFE